MAVREGFYLNLDRLHALTGVELDTEGIASGRCMRYTEGRETDQTSEAIGWQV